MRASRFLVLLLLLSSLIPAQAADNPTQKLHSLFDSDWEYQMQHDPVGASELGDRRWNDRWGDVSLNSLREQFQHANLMLKELHAINRGQLSPEEQLNYDV